MKRPFFNNSIKDLHEIFKTSPDNVEILELLIHELSFRKLQTIQVLKSEVFQKLESMKKGADHLETIEKSSEASNKIGRQKKNLIYPVNPQKIIDNKPIEILSAWSVLELLSPQTFRKPEELCNGDRKLIHYITQDFLPWEGEGEEERPNTRLYYHIPLGTVKMSSVSQELLEVFGAGQSEIIQPSGSAIIAFITLDSKGCLIQDNALTFSSFAWAYPQVLQGNIRELDRWEEQEIYLKSGLLRKLSFYSEEGEPKPLTLEIINNAYQYLIEKLGIEKEHGDKPNFILKKYQWSVLKDPPEPTLLNSFFLRDLILAKKMVEENEGGAALESYLGIKKVENQTDVLKEKEFLKKVLLPENTPLGRWPAKEGHSLVLLQQAAVNIIKSDLKEEGLISVNGPPGTGKTTLLRDLISSVIVDRAKALVNFTDPENAFSFQEKMGIGNFFINLSSVSNLIKGHEILVASSNNKAVENISKELPNINAMPSDLPPPQYFRTTSNAASGTGQDTWGLIAAVLGNSTNMSSFYKAFWSDDETSLKSYLLTAAGKHIDVTEKDSQTGESFERPPHVVQWENPPANKEEALKIWEDTCQKFKEALNLVQKKVDILEKSHDALSKISVLQIHSDQYAQDLKNIQGEIDVIKSGQNQQVHEREETQDKLEITSIDIEMHNENRPHFFARLFQRSTWKAWHSKLQQLKREKAILSLKLRQIKRDYNEALKTLEKAEIKYSDIQNQYQNIMLELNKTKEVIEEGRLISGDRLGDINFWEQPRDQLQKSTIWLGEILQKERDHVFSMALEIHKAFIGAAAVPIRHNLTALMQVFNGRSLATEHLYLLPHLWATLFLVVPVLSTTFASIEKMIGKLPPKSLGWLFVDEAGQALPQSAVGALMRSQKAVIVGDPLQIEPVVSLPERLTQVICREFGVDPEIWSAPRGSVQTCADAVTKFGTTFQGNEGERWVGLPLLVHRRCNNPMFKISNRIAYDNLMVYGAYEQPSIISNLLGPSSWFHVIGASEGNWCPEEGEFVIEILKKIVSEGLMDPDLYIIAPFRVVAERMKERLTQEKELMGKITENSRQWIKERVGTIHTFQGKESEAVIMMLGAQSPSQIGARRWAGSRPNLINVAVTRAKRAFYVIGNKDLWAEHGSFQVLAKTL